MGRLWFRLLSGDLDAGFRFELLSEQGDVVVTSDEFADRELCLAAIRALLDVLSDAERFTVRAANEGRFLEVTAPDGQLLARSRTTDADVCAVLRDSLVEAAAEQEEYEIALPAIPGAQTVTGPAFRQALQISLTERYDFARASASGVVGFEPFQSARDSRFYFHFNDAAGMALLYSRGFSSAAQRNRRLRMVAKSAVLQQRYERREEDGRYFFVLNARNGQEIARSRAFVAVEERETALAWLWQEMPTHAARFSERVRKESAACEEIERLSLSDAAGFELLRNRADKLYYFLFRAEAGRALLFSQGYKTSASRDQAIRTLIRVGAGASAYETTAEEETFGFAVRAGNRQRIARSRAFDTAEAVTAAIALAQSHLPAWAATYAVTAASVETAQAERLTLHVERSAPVPPPVVSTASLTPEAADPEEEASHEPVAALEPPEISAAQAAPVVVPAEPAAEPGIAAQAAVTAPAGNKDAGGAAGKRRAAGGAFAPLPCCLGFAAIAAVCLLLFLYPRLANHSPEPRTATGDQKAGANPRLAAALPPPSAHASSLVPPPSSSRLPAPSTPPTPAASPAAAVRPVPPARGSSTPQTSTPQASAPQTSAAQTSVSPTSVSPTSVSPTSAARRLGLPAGSMEASLAEYLSRPGGKEARTFVMGRLRYPANSHAMNSEGVAEVQTLARVLSAYPHAKIAIHGYLDGRESEVYAGNDGHGMHQLSRIRAQCLLLRLHFLGVSGERMSISGEGKSRPVTDNATEEARQRNRRIELIVTPS